MLKTFLGVDLKIGGQIILWLHLVENLLLFLVIALRTHVIPTNATREFIVILRDYKIDVHTYFRHFLEVYSTLAICFCLLGILIRRSKFIMWLYFFHQGIGIEVLIMLIPVVILKSSFGTLSLLYSFPLIIFIIIKGYCWLVMVSLYKHEQKDEQRLIFGQQWIINSLFVMQPSVRLTLPSENTNFSYEPL